MKLTNNEPARNPQDPQTHHHHRRRRRRRRRRRHRHHHHHHHHQGFYQYLSTNV